LHQILVGVGLAPSFTAARRLITDNAVKVNGVVAGLDHIAKLDVHWTKSETITIQVGRHWVDVKILLVITYQTKPDAKGFLTEETGVVEDLTKPYLIVRQTKIFAFHPDFRAGGRFLPIPRPWTFQGKEYNPAVIAVDANEVNFVLDK
jgi:hypothetical protein